MYNYLIYLHIKRVSLILYKYIVSGVIGMFVWSENFSVNNDLIDSQHKRLFEIGNNINDILKNFDEKSDCEKLKHEINELVRYTKYHFEEEEILMKKYNYLELDIHREEHESFINYLDDIDVDNIENCKKEDLVDLLKFVASWIFKHISNTDYKYGDYIKQNSK